MTNINPSAPLVENYLPGRTNFNLSCCRATSIALGTTVPLYIKEVLPNDRIRIKPILRVRTLPLVSGLLGSFSLRVAWFYESDANMYGYLDNDDTVSASQLQNMNLHTVECSTLNHKYAFGMFQSRVSSGCLANYLYAPYKFNPYRATNGSNFVTFDLGRWIGFWDIYRNFYVNRQVGSFPIFPTDDSDPDNPNSRVLRDIRVDVLDRALKLFRTYENGVTLRSFYSDFVAKYGVTSLRQLIAASFSRDIESTTFNPETNSLKPLSGLPLCNLRADVFTRMMSATAPTGTVTFQTNVGSLVTASRLFAFINNVDISGGRVSDWMRFRWGVDVKRAQDKPICLSVDTITLNVDDLRTTSSTDNSPAASQVGYIDLGSKLSKVSFNNKTGFGGNLFCIVTITPNIYYSQGIEQEVLATKYMDKYSPEFANENFVQVPRVCLGALPDSQSQGSTEDFSPFTSIGRTTSWWHYQTDVNRAFGDLSHGAPLGTWLLTQNYYGDYHFDSDAGQGDFYYSPYCVPYDYQYAFADSSATAQNFIIQFGIDNNANRLMPSYSQPKIK